MLDVIVKLNEPTAPRGGWPEDRAGYAVARSRALEEASRPVEEAITALGGEIRSRLWVSTSILVRVPDSEVERIKEIPGVRGVTAPRT